MGLFGQKAIASKLLRQFGPSVCGPQIHLVDEIARRISELNFGELDLLPFTGDDLVVRYPNADGGFVAAFDTALIRGRLDAVIGCQDFIGSLAERRVGRLRAIPRDKTCGPALVAIQAATAVLVFDLIGESFGEEDLRRATREPFLVPKTQVFTRGHFDAAVEPWNAAFGQLVG